jgi:hypothetical protein
MDRHKESVLASSNTKSGGSHCSQGEGCKSLSSKKTWGGARVSICLLGCQRCLIEVLP